jgi:hypothetical protein
MTAMEATIFTGWIYDHLLPHAEKVKVAHSLMLRAVALGSKNYFFCGSNPGRVRAAVIYSLVSSVKLNGLNPERYLRRS